MIPLKPGPGEPGGDRLKKAEEPAREGGLFCFVAAGFNRRLPWIARRRLDRFKVRGEIAISAGFGLAFIDSETPDDPVKLAKLKVAATAILGEPI